jgi:hypothetical protein
MPNAPGPSLAKATADRVVQHNTRRLVAVRDGFWARVLDRADVVSEGAVVNEPHGAVYYGSTSLRCCSEPLPEALQRLDSASLGQLLCADPHARLRLVRLVHREATARAQGSLDTVRIELRSQAVPKRAETGPAAWIVEVVAEVSAAVGGRAKGVATR